MTAHEGQWGLTNSFDRTQELVGARPPVQILTVRDTNDSHFFIDN